jgi:hypothetical protein
MAEHETLNTMSTETAEKLEATNWADPTGKGMIAAMADIDFTDDFDKIRSTPTPVEKPAVTPDPVQKPAETVVTPEEKPEPLIDEDFFGTETKDEPVIAEKVNAFDEKGFDAETEEQAKGLDAKAGDKFKALRAELKEFKSKSFEAVVPEETRLKLETLELKAQEAEGLKQRLEEISSQSAKLKMENSDVYKREVLDPAAETFKRSDALAEMYEKEPAILRAIIKERDRRVQNELIKEHLSEFSDFDRSEVYRQIQDFNGFVAKRESLLANAEQELERQEALRVEATAKQLAEQRTSVQTIQKEIWEKYKDTIPGLVDDNGETKEFRDMMAKGLSIDFSTARAKDQAFAAFAGTALPYAVKQIAALRRELAELNKAAGKEVKGRPAASSAIKPTEVSSDTPKSFMEAMAMDFAS